MEQRNTQMHFYASMCNCAILAWLIHVSTNHFERCVQEYATVVFTAPRQSKYPKTVSPSLWPDPQSCISCDSIIEQPSLLVHHNF